jgi:hypothetical protein
MADDKSLSQDDIDALINQVSGGAKPAQPPAARPAAPPAAGAHAHDDIDALIDQVTHLPPAAAPRGPAAQDTVAAPFAQLAQAGAAPAGEATRPGGGSRAKPATSGSGSAALGQDDIDQLLAELGAAPPAPAAAAPDLAAARPSVPTTSAARASESVRQGTTSNGPTLALSPDELDALVQKQAGQTSNHREAPMIDQTDIDALVRQLANATGEPDTKKISEALAKHEGEIDQLLTANADPKMTVDAIEMPAARKGSTVAGVAPAAAPSGLLPVMAPAELRGTRWLLAAAVLFLAMCATTLVLVVGAISGLQHELKAQHLAQLAPSDSFSDDFKAALAQLATGDNDEVAKGVLFLQRLKVRHPSHEGEIALELARHFRRKGLFRQAAEEYAVLAESGPFDDPRVYLEYADALDLGRDQSGAIRQVYRLLASEEAYLGPRDRHGLPRPAAETARNRDALRDAYLALGRLLSAGWDEQHGGAQVASTAPAHPAAPAADPHAAPAKPPAAAHPEGHHP